MGIQLYYATGDSKRVRNIPSLHTNTKTNEPYFSDILNQPWLYFHEIIILDLKSIYSNIFVCCSVEPVLSGHHFWQRFYGDLMFSVICLIWQNLSYLSYVAESLSSPSPEFILHCIALPCTDSYVHVSCAQSG